MTIVDTSVWIDYFNGKVNREAELLDDLLSKEPIALGDIILTEILQGFTKNSDFLKAKSVLDILTCYPLCNKEIAIKSAENYRYLRKKGIPPSTWGKTVDVIIATFCIENDFSLLHNDKGFDPFKQYLGLKTL